ncbi:MAG TPA: hypothetical protein VFL47_14645 [Flavisolibacter sp.]|nr:hypothetical protein [Flavisolibacter sp.]
MPILLRKLRQNTNAFGDGFKKLPTGTALWNFCYCTSLVVMKTFLLVVCVIFSSFTHAQQEKINSLAIRYRPLIASLQEPDSLYVYTVYSNWGSGIDYFISFKNAKHTSGYYIGDDVAFSLLAGRNLIKNDSLTNLHRTIIDTVSVEEINRFVADNNLWTLAEEKDLIPLCPSRVYRNDTLFISQPLIEDGANFRLTKIVGGTVCTKEFYEIYAMNEWCPAQKEYRLWVQLDKLIRKTFSRSQQLSRKLIDEYRERMPNQNGVL